MMCHYLYLIMSILNSIFVVKVVQFETSFSVKRGATNWFNTSTGKSSYGPEAWT